MALNWFLEIGHGAPTGVSFMEARSKNKPVYENAVTGIWGSCILQVMSSWFTLQLWGTDLFLTILRYCACDQRNYYTS